MPETTSHSLPEISTSKKNNTDINAQDKRLSSAHKSNPIIFLTAIVYVFSVIALGGGRWFIERQEQDQYQQQRAHLVKKAQLRQQKQENELQRAAQAQLLAEQKRKQEIIEKQEKNAARKEIEKLQKLAGEFVDIPKGCFQMGSPDSEKNRNKDENFHQVCVEEFKLMTHEVTKGQFRIFINDTVYKTDAEKRTGEKDGCYVDNSGSAHWAYVSGKNWEDTNYAQLDNHPVVCVSYNDAIAYSEWLNHKTGKRFRLPTEAEWEYAARAGSKSLFYWGNDTNYSHLCDYGNSANSETKDYLNWASSACNDGYKYTAPIKSYKPNSYNLYDMSGNVWEWTCSTYTESYNDSEKQCSDGSEMRSLRGGSWSDEPRYIRSADRFMFSTTSRYLDIGFRLVQEL